MSALFPRNMHLIKKSRRMLSGIFHARPDCDPATTRSRSKALRSRRRKSKRRTASLSVAQRTMDLFLSRGKKRKREDVDDGDDDEWAIVQCKKRFVGGGISPIVAEENSEREQVRYDDIPRLLLSHCEASNAEPGELPDDYKELLEAVHSNLENLTITDTDNSFPTSSITSTRQTSIEPHTDLDSAWLEGLQDWNNRYRSRRCHSETSTRILSYANAVTGNLPNGSGRRSAPPNLDTAWSSPSELDRRASLWSVSALSDDGTLDEMLNESALELVLFADSQAGDDVDVGREAPLDVYVNEEEEATQVGTEVENTDTGAAAEDIDIEAAIAAVAEAIRKTTAWQGVETAALHADEPRLEVSKVAGESAEERELESGYWSDPVSEQEQESAPTQTTKPPSESASPPAEPISELAFRMQYDSLVNWGFDSPEVELQPRVCQRQVTAEDVSSRIRAVKDRMMESLLDIEQRLRPHCPGARV
ncbi:hypothetical protein MKX07_000827 [Trichoderma sp. CBMAI-0711]|uniref:Uncharacterized protein n=1 Tax=Trichoderma parareesei TaxID=858221 RepID=A0A2H2ZCY6_TRIPA|nr:hypothetical protein MKX07_000827 [Trichoderma sp. CBMAI-0711]OTA05497.1 hypothetical protein A9Z42_0061670 [Trichoderma parareesei]